MKNPNIDIKFGASIKSCKECKENSVGRIIFEYFKPTYGLSNVFIKYKDGICYINDQILMSFIRMANPLQPDRKIQIVSDKEFRELCTGKDGNKCNEQ
ncbi:hypothetical protein [Clostridium sp. BNL1100]|uniref:hypothetical protein n=1 Tax=Clostridium sp. BNL1100 TaxID=755731 RepID=UPI00024A7F16|nr:hypothetical protein [Clostridium sp. BNL1100]AEY65423.1 hypothetical protein Clo1100_1171 [Clostridium sp. BNL1100]